MGVIGNHYVWAGPFPKEGQLSSIWGQHPLALIMSRLCPKGTQITLCMNMVGRELTRKEKCICIKHGFATICFCSKADGGLGTKGY